MIRRKTHLKYVLMVTILWVVLLLAACSPAGNFLAPVTPTETLRPATGNNLVIEPTPNTEATQPAVYDPGLEPFVQAAREDLAARLNVPASDLAVVKAEVVLWPDASAGCPQPGMEYIQVQEEGVLVQLAYKGQIYEYHQGESRAIFLCGQ